MLLVSAEKDESQESKVSAHQVALPKVNTAERKIARDCEIAMAAQAGSSAAFVELHATYSRRLYKTILSIVKIPDDAEDALQDTFLRAHLAIRTFEGRSTIYSWLTRIAINSALSILRKRRVRSEILFDPQTDAETFSLQFQDPSLNPEQVCHLQQRLAKVKSLIRNLSPHLQEPLRMRIEKEASIEEISQALKITRAAAKTRLHRAKRRLSATRNIKHFAANYHRALMITSASDVARPVLAPSQTPRKLDSEEGTGNRHVS